MRKSLMLAALLLLTACSGGEAGTAVPERTESGNAAIEGGSAPEPEAGGAAGSNGGSEPRTPGYEVVADGLDSPWSIAFDGDTVYVSEREGAVVRIDGGTIERQPLALDKPVRQEGESGFMGFVLSPSFETDRTAIAYYSYAENGRMLNRIAKLRQEDGAWQENAVLLDGIPGEMYHDGGRLAFGPDGYLYATTGDATNESNAQDPDSLAGKILRMKPDGGIPADNPDPDSYVYSYGHRNPQGLGWAADGTLYAAEHGPSATPGGHDELNIIRPGGNYGWPDIIGDERKSGMIPPLYHTGEATLAPSGMAVTDSGALLVAGLRGERLAVFSAEGEPLGELLAGEGRVRDVAIHDGRIYVLTNNTDGRGSPGERDDRLLMLTGVTIP